MSVRGIFVVLIACAIYLLCFFPYMDKWYDKAKQFFEFDNEKDDKNEQED